MDGARRAAAPRRRSAAACVAARSAASFSASFLAASALSSSSLKEACTLQPSAAPERATLSPRAVLFTMGDGGSLHSIRPETVHTFMHHNICCPPAHGNGGCAEGALLGLLVALDLILCALKVWVHLQLPGVNRLHPACICPPSRVTLSWL